MTIKYIILNMWDNQVQLYPERLARIKTEEEAKQYVLDMWDEFGVTANIFYDPSEHDPSQMDKSEPKEEDDLFINCRVGFLRWVAWWIGLMIKWYEQILVKCSIKNLSYKI